MTNRPLTFRVTEKSFETLNSFANWFNSCSKFASIPFLHIHTSSLGVKFCISVVLAFSIEFFFCGCLASCVFVCVVFVVLVLVVNLVDLFDLFDFGVDEDLVGDFESIYFEDFFCKHALRMFIIICYLNFNF